MARHCSRQLAFVVAALAALGACTDNDEIGDEQLDTIAEAVTTPSWTAPSCSLDALGPPSADTCNGPWRYSWTYNVTDSGFCNARVAEAGPAVCDTWNTCRHWSFGYTTNNRYEYHPSTTGWYTETCATKCSTKPPYDCNTTCSNSPATKCATVSSLRKSAILADYDPDPSSEADDGEPSAAYDAQLDALFAAHPNFVHSATIPGTTTYSTGTDGTHYSYRKYQCQIDIDYYPQPRSATGAACGCKTCSDSATAETQPGATKPSLPTHYQYTSLANDGVTPGPRCTTCDELALAADPASLTASQVEAKFDCLARADEAWAAPNPELDASRIARRKLLQIIGGQYLVDDTRRGRIDADYADSTAAPACQEPFALAPECVDSIGDLLGKLQMCKDLTLAAAPPRSRRARIDACLAALQDAAARAAPCGAATRDQMEAVVVALIGGASDGYDASNGLQDDVQRSLYDIDRWWEAASASGVPEETRNDDGSLLVNGVWKAAHRATLDLPVSVSGDALAAALLADVSTQGLATDWEVLRAAFTSYDPLPDDPSNTPAPPLDAPPLIGIVADALRGTYERVDALSPIHDTACRFSGCKPAAGPARSTAVTQTWALLAALDRKPALTAALASATQVAAQHPQLITALTAMRDRFDLLQTAWTKLAGSAKLSNLGSYRPVATEATALAEIVRAATARSSSYAASGRFASARPALSVGILRRADLVSFLDTQIDGVAAEHADYRAARLDTVNDLLGQLDAAAGVQSLADQLFRLRDEEITLAKQIADLQQREAIAGTAWTEFVAMFEDLIASDVLDPDAAYAVDLEAPLSISGRNATHRKGTALDIAAASVKRVTMSAGEIMRIDVTGSWAPTCALQVIKIPAPTGKLSSITVPIGTADAQTGPEGYAVQWSSDGYVAHGYSDSTTDSQAYAATLSACAQATGGITTLPALGSVSTTLSACSSYEARHTSAQETVDSTGWKNSASVSFSGGLRVPFAPFPNAPIGSLVAVTTARGNPSLILDARVVNRRSVIVAPTPPSGLGTEVDIHFVVNDIRGDDVNLCARPAADALTVEIAVVTPFGAVARAIGSAMGAALADLEAKAPLYYAGGTLQPEEKSALRSMAWAKVQQFLLPTGVGIGNVPRELSSLFDAWLDMQLASIGRRAQIVSVARDINRLGQEALQFEHELDAADGRSRLLALVPRWRLRNLAAAELRSDVDQLADVLDRHAAPIFELRDPARLSTFRQNTAAQLEALLAVDIAGNPEDVIDDFRIFAEDVRDSIAVAEFELPSTFRRTVAIAFPRNPQVCSSQSCDFSAWRAASVEAARTAWSSAEDAAGGHVATFHVRPADLYSAGGGNARLSCHDIAPVIRRAGLFVSTTAAADIGDLGREVYGIAGAGDDAISFPVVGGSVELWADAATGVPLPLPVDSGSAGQAIEEFGSSELLGAAAGLSPFTTYQIDLSSFYNTAPLNTITEADALILVLEIERRVTTDTAFVPGVCQTSF